MSSPALQTLAAANIVLADQLHDIGSDIGRYHARKLHSCSHRVHQDSVVHYCNSPLCLMCSRLKNQTSSSVLQMRLRSFQERYRKGTLLFGTFSAADTETQNIGKIVRSMSRSWKSLISSVHSVLGWLRASEIAQSTSNAELEDPHVHVIVAVKLGYSGRYYLSWNDWVKGWQHHLPDGFSRPRSVDAGVQMKPLRDIADVANYIFPWGPSGEKGYEEKARFAISDPQRYMERYEQLYKLGKYEYSGELNQQEIPKPALDPTGFTQHWTRKGWNTFEGQLARMTNPKSTHPYIPIPISVA